MVKRCRLAFLTPAFVTEYANGGGLASYLNRMTRALTDSGHEAEVFVLSDRAFEDGAVLDHGGVRVHLVRREAQRGWWKWGRVATRFSILRMWRAPVEILSGARQLADAFEKRDAEAPFDLVQSSDYFATGLYVKPRAGRPHLVRSSMARELLARVDQGDSARTRRWWIKFELEQMRRAEIAYAPSEYAAAYYRERLGRAVQVVRPPGEVVDFVPDVAIRTGGAELPGKFLLHFGQLRSYKGTPWLLDALAEAWKEELEMTVLLVGPVRDSRLRRRLDSMSGDKRVVWLRELPRAEMYALIQKSAATVLPSLADNFPNTVLESLALGVPVIGGRGASVDELVEDGKTGELVELGDVKGLAQSMIRAWRGELAAKKGFVWESGVRKLMEPSQAVRALGEVAGIELV